MLKSKLSFTWTVENIHTYVYEAQKTLDMINSVQDHFNTIMKGVSPEDLDACQREEVIDKERYYPNDPFLPLESIKQLTQDRLDRLNGASFSVMDSPENVPMSYLYRIPPVCTHSYQIWDATEGAANKVVLDGPGQESIALLATLEFWSA